MPCVTVSLAPGTSGIWMTSSSPSMARSPMPGEQWISMGLPSMSWCSIAVTRRRSGSSSASCSKAGSTSRGRSSPTSSPVTEPPNGKSFQGWNIGSTKASIIVQKTHINLPGNESEPCEGSNRQAKPSGFFRLLFSPISSHFRPRWHLLSAQRYREEMRQRFAVWAEVAGLQSAA